VEAHRLDWAGRKSTTTLVAVLGLIVMGAGLVPADASTIVALRGRDDAGLAALVAAQQDPASPDYRRWVTGSEFGRRFGAAPRDLKRVERWLRDGGCRLKRARGRQQVTCVGSQPGDVPSQLRPLVEDVLDPATPLELRFSLARDRLQPRTVDATGTYMSPDDYAKFFGYSALHAAGIEGWGQTIGIVGASSVDLADIDAFRARFSLPTLELTQAGDPSAMSPSTDAELEAVLDVSWAGAVAPRARIVLAVSSGGLVDAIGYLVNRSDISVISLSVVLIPGGHPSPRPFIRQALRLFRQAAAQGQTVLIASGDLGALLEVKPKRKRGVDPMTGSPFVTAVGGTTPIFSDPRDIIEYGNEVVWQEGQAASGGGRGRARRPSWQRGSPTRTVPDVALPAANVYPIFFNGDPRLQCCVGGTSAAAPSWAGLVALLNQQRGVPAGLLNPTLYDLGRAQAKGGPAVFHDIVIGSSDTTLARGFPAKPGYDLATGWGTPDVPALFAAFP
jgi:pseudomonalisin